MRIAVLGCGSIGLRHIRNLQAMGYADIVAYDPVEESREKTTAELKIPALSKLGDVWAREPVVALITAPSDTHTRLALEAASNGCHLFIEKPLSHTLQGIEDLGAAVEERELVTMVACNMRFHPGPAMVKKLIESRIIGRAISARIQAGSYLPRWRPWQDYRKSYSASVEWGGAVLDCIHEIDLALWYLGPAELVAAAQIPASCIGLKTDGLAEIVLSHRSGALSSVHLNFIQRDYQRLCQIIGEMGTIYWDFVKDRVLVYGQDGELKQTHAGPVAWEVNQMYIDEMEHFLNAVQNRSQTVNPISGGVAALRIALAARQAGVERRI